MPGSLGETWWMLSSYWTARCPALYSANNCNNSSQNNPEKNVFTLPKNECIRKKSMDCCFKPERERDRERESDRERALLCKVITLTSNQLYVESCSNVIYLLCTAKGQGLKGSLKGSVWFGAYPTVFLTESDLGHL